MRKREEIRRIIDFKLTGEARPGVARPRRKNMEKLKQFCININIYHFRGQILQVGNLNILDYQRIKKYIYIGLPCPLVTCWLMDFSCI